MKKTRSYLRPRYTVKMTIVLALKIQHESEMTRETIRKGFFHCTAIFPLLIQNGRAPIVKKKNKQESRTSWN